MSVVDILIPTWNLPEYAIPCVNSILHHGDERDVFHIYIINNGDSQHNGYFPKSDKLTILQQEKNLGWEGGLQAGLTHSTAPYVIFMNDDTFIPQSSSKWLEQMFRHFIDPRCAAVGPSSNVVMGKQQCFDLDRPYFMVNYLIGFCMMIRRSALDEAGGVDATLPGGDDLDLSIRLRNKGYYLVCDKDIFVWHHGFKSGERAAGADYNSVAAIERTNFALIRKHGIRAFQNLWGGPPWNPDEEGKLIASLIGKEEKTVDLGCGSRKTVPWALGIDILPKGTFVPHVYPKGTSVADLVADVSKPLPLEPESQDVIIARHILEHIQNVQEVIQNWKLVLRHGGRLIIAVPNDQTARTKELDPDHKQAFTPETLKATMESMGLKTVDLLDPKNNVSFVGIWEKNGL